MERVRLQTRHKKIIIHTYICICYNKSFLMYSQTELETFCQVWQDWKCLKCLVSRYHFQYYLDYFNFLEQRYTSQRFGIIIAHNKLSTVCQRTPVISVVCIPYLQNSSFKQNAFILYHFDRFQIHSAEIFKEQRQFDSYR